MSDSAGTDEVSSLDIDDLDPSLMDGSKVVFDREVPIEIRTLPPPTSSSQSTVGLPHAMESIRTRIFTKGSTQLFTHFRIELSSESDLFFHYTQSLDNDSFTRLKEDQRLMIDFLEFPEVLMKMMNSVIKEPKTFLVVLSLAVDGSGKLDFIHNLEYKYVELLSLQFTQSSDDMVQRQITFRYNSLKQKLAVMQSRLHDVSNMVKAKNPSLLLQIQKGSHSTEGPESIRKEGLRRNFYP